MCLVANSYALGWKWRGPGFELCHRHINLIILSWKWVLQIESACDTLTLHPHLNTYTHPHNHTSLYCSLNGRVNENAFAFWIQVPTPSSNANVASERTAFTLLCIQNLLSTYLTSNPLLPFLFCCFLITKSLALGGCAWVNRAVGACHVCSSGERSSQRSGMRWFVVIDSYLETGLMELSKLYANRLFPYHCRCTLLRCTAHTQAHTRTLSRTCKHTHGLTKHQHIMGTQILSATTVLKRNMRRGCQISNQMFLLGLLSCKQALCTESFALPPLTYHRLVISAKHRLSLFWRVPSWANTGCVNTMAILHLGTQWENYPISHLCSQTRVFIFTRWIMLLQNVVVQNSLWKSGYEHQHWFWLVLFITWFHWEWWSHVCLYWASSFPTRSVTIHSAHETEMIF